VDKGKELLIVEKLREDYFVRGKLNGDVERSRERRVHRVVFKAPGGYLATARFREKEAKPSCRTKPTASWACSWTLHRGKDSGDEWSLIIDGVSILFVIVSLTGLILWTSLRARAQYGLIVIIVGVAVSVVVYFKYVPQ